MNTNLPRNFQTLQALLERTIATDNGCLEWQGYRDADGYGKVKVTNKPKSAHRIALFFVTGIYGEVAMHSCDNPPCINPDHLRWGTVQENNADMMAKGRHAKGDALAFKGMAHPKARLTDSQVIEIRTRYAAGGITHRQLGREYGVSHAMIGDITRRECWSHI